jgi:ribosome-associated translation inhibitor RaiA
MNIDIRTDHVPMRAEWHRAIDDWVAHCRRDHPAVADVDVTLRHLARDPADVATVEATVHGHHVRGTGSAPMMTMALHDAFDALESELLVHEAVGRSA